MNKDSFPYNYGKTYTQFLNCLKWAKKGKTFIFYHPDFVAMDHKTWIKLNKKTKPMTSQSTSISTPMPTIYYDEFKDVDK